MASYDRRRRGAAAAKNSQKPGRHQTVVCRAHLRDYVVLPFDNGMCWEWARIVSKKGWPISAADGWVAATAVWHGVPLVTHNLRNFRHVDGLSLISVPVERG